MIGGSDVCSHPPTAKGREEMWATQGWPLSGEEGPPVFLLLRSFPVPSLSVSYFHCLIRMLFESPFFCWVNVRRLQATVRPPEPL